MPRIGKPQMIKGGRAFRYYLTYGTWRQATIEYNKDHESKFSSEGVMTAGKRWIIWNMEEARELFLRTADLYKKAQNFFDATTMYYKAGECRYALKEYEEAIEHFMQSADLSFKKGFDRFGVSALEYVKDCQKALGNNKEVEALEKKIKEVKTKLKASF